MKAAIVTAAALFGVVAVSAACGGEQAAAPTPTAIPPATTTGEPSTSREVDDGDMLARVAYLDMTMTLEDLASEVDRWKLGETDALEEARELADRVRTALEHVAWPSGLDASVRSLEEALGALAGALDNADAAAVDAGLAAQMEALHDLGHDLDARPLPPAPDDVAVRTGFHELSMLLEALEASINSWEPGQPAPEEADEDIERIEAILGGISWPEPLVSSVDSLDAAFHDLEGALTAGDPAGAATRLQALSEARHDAAHAFYEWLAGQPQASGHSATHLAVLDLRELTAAWRAQLEAWQRGDAGALDEAAEEAERIEAVLDSVSWPSALTANVEAMDTAFHDAESAAAAGDPGAAGDAVQAFEGAYHDLLHEFYGWLEGARSGGA